MDGIFSNRWAGSGMCYCEHCRAELPRGRAAWTCRAPTDPQDPGRRAYIVWRQQRLFELWRLWDAEIREINPDACFIPNSGGGALGRSRHEDHRRTARRCCSPTARRAAASMPPWANGKNGKEYRSTMGRKPIGGIFSVGVEEPYRWKDSVQSGAEIRLWALDGIANGLRPWFTKFSGTLHDRRWLPVVEELYGWHYRNERYLRNERAAGARRPWSTRSRPPSSTAASRRAEGRGPHAGLLPGADRGAHPFEMVHDRLLDAEPTSIRSRS